LLDAHVGEVESFERWSYEIGEQFWYQYAVVVRSS
jgi:hypothetical protein